MIPGSIRLGINSAFGSDASVGLRPGFWTRAQLPAWNTSDRVRKAYEPYPAWIGPFGHFADGPMSMHYTATWTKRPIYYATHHHDPDDRHPNTNGGTCMHLTLVANCTLDYIHTGIGVPPDYTKEFAIRPYRWQEEPVQSAYEAVSDGDVTAAEIASLANVGMHIGDDEHPGTAEEVERCEEIHSEWDGAAASYLAFGPSDRNVRPFSCPIGDKDMAGSSQLYSFPAPNVYGGGTIYASYESGNRGYSGQGFYAWRETNEGRPTSADWSRIGGAIFASSCRPGHDEAFDLRILKTVHLIRGKHRAELGKEQSVDYDISLFRISGARTFDDEVHGTNVYPILIA